MFNEGSENISTNRNLFACGNLNKFCYIMVQEFNVLKCHSCNFFQVHIVKKAKNWVCKMCNSKQSIVKILGEGSAKDCRLRVQQLNKLEQSKQEIVQDEKNIINDLNSLERISDTGTVKTVSKWDVYLNNTGAESLHEKENVKRKSKWNSYTNSGNDKNLQVHELKKRKFNSHENSWESTDTEPNVSACNSLSPITISATYHTYFNSTNKRQHSEEIICHDRKITSSVDQISQSTIINLLNSSNNNHQNVLCNSDSIKPVEKVETATRISTIFSEDIVDDVDSILDF